MDRFNWATRVRAWKPASLKSSAEDLRKASIGPRASARGNGLGLRLSPLNFYGLQLGHARPRVETLEFQEFLDELKGFNWATRVRAWKPYYPGCECASCSKSFNWATRVRAWKPRDRYRGRAPNNRFNWATRVRAWKLRYLGGKPKQDYTLQLGHARPRVETPPELPLTICRICFNWATRVRAWKLLEVCDGNRVDYLASIGPRASARGNSSLDYPLSPVAICFNWATRVRAWKLANRLITQREGRASIGPRASARGNWLPLV